jgi:hypothetical protein
MVDAKADRRMVVAGDGRGLEVLVSGPAAGFPLLIHMGTPNGLVPLPSQLDPGREDVRVIQYAPPGYCRSAPHPNRSVADAATDTAAILNELGIDSCNGGMVWGRPICGGVLSATA